MPETKTFKLAPMARTFATMTFVYFGLTVLMLAGIPFGPGSRIVGWALFALILVVWFWFKPAAIIVDAQGLLLRFRMRSLRVSRADIASLERLNTRDLGWMLRISVGGLWGAFGMFKTQREGMIDGYFSTNENLVLIKFKNRRPLLLSPDDAEGFVKALG